MEISTEWIVGFVDGEGCFHIGISQHSDMTAGVQVLPEFTVVQHERDVQVLHALKTFFGCGVVRKNHGDRMCYRVRDRRHLLERILPFFMDHSLKTKKHVDFLKFRDVVLMMEKGGHLTADGLQHIREVASATNRRSAKIKSSPHGNVKD